MSSPTKEYAQKIFTALRQHYSHAKMILQWGNNWELLVAIILSAQCTDKKVNEVTSKLFPKYRIKKQELSSKYKQGVTREEGIPTARSEKSRTSTGGRETSGRTPMEEEVIELVNFAEIPISELEQDIKSTGFYRAKAKNVQAAAQVVLEKFHGVLPKTISELISIPGVGRKTANVFLTNAYHIDEGIAVDTHVKKQALALGLTKNTNPDKIEQDLMKLFPQSEWHQLTYMLIEHGRNLRKKKSDQSTCGNPTCILGI